MLERDNALVVLWRRRWLMLGAVGLFALATFVLSSLMSPVYSAKATLVVNQSANDSGFDRVQANQAYARTLAHLIDSPNVAESVVPTLTFSTTAERARAAMAFSPVNETQLLEVTARDGSQARAIELANAWATAFTTYVEQNLQDAAPATLSVADRAVEADVVRPKPVLYTLVALILGLALAVTGLLLWARFDDRVHDLDVLAEDLGAPVIGVLPPRGNQVVEQQRYDEALRVLRTNLQFSSERALQMVAVTSSTEYEGKSTLVAELSRSFALLSLVKASVLAVDADLRRPTLHEKLGVESRRVKRAGLATFLRRETSFAESVLPTELESLVLMPAGPAPASPSTLLGFASSREALDSLRSQAEVVIVDTPPVTLGADASLIGADVDGVLLVVDVTRTKRRQALRAAEQLRRVQTDIIGIIVNRWDGGSDAPLSYYYTREDDAAADDVDNRSDRPASDPPVERPRPDSSSVVSGSSGQ